MKYLLALFLFIFSFKTIAGNPDSTGVFKPHHAVSVMLGHSLISQDIQNNGKKSWLALPIYALNYNLWVHPKWAVGLHSDIVLEHYIVAEDLSKSSNKTIERNYPFSAALTATFKPTKHWMFTLGSGEEFAHTGNLFLLRAGVEYGVHLPKNWEVFGAVSYTYRLQAYDSYLLGLGFTKLF